MVLSNPFPGHDALATFADLRRDLEGAVVRNAAGVMRAGVFPAHFNPLVTGRSDMRVNILDFRAVQNRGGAVFIANAGTDTSVILDAAPGANKRIDLIYVTMQSATLGDAASLPLFGVVKGTASPSPTVPALPPNVADAIRLATVEIPAGATTTLSAGVVITQVYPYTAMAGGTVVVRNSVELAAWAPADGAKVFSLADDSEFVRIGGGWAGGGAGYVTRNAVPQSVSATVYTGIGAGFGSPITAGGITWEGDCFKVAQAGRYKVELSAYFQATGGLLIGPRKNTSAGTPDNFWGYVTAGSVQGDAAVAATWDVDLPANALLYPVGISGAGSATLRPPATGGFSRYSIQRIS